MKKGTQNGTDFIFETERYLILPSHREILRRNLIKRQIVNVVEKVSRETAGCFRECSNDDFSPALPQIKLFSRDTVPVPR